jgi:hypothetical protein
MGERVTISYRGAAYELGRGKHSYGIWPVGTPRTEPVERWPETPEGWHAAWSRFTGIEAPGTIVAASPSRGLALSASSGVATALLGIGVLCGIVSLFPGYLGGSSVASQPVLLVPHAIYLGAWTLSAVLILLGGTRRRIGALLGAGTSIVTFGLFFTDLGQAIAYGGRIADAGLWFGLVGWLACAAGSIAACFIRSGDPQAVGVGVGRAGAPAGAPAGIGRFGRPRGYEMATAVVIAVTGIGAAIAFAPSWDSYLLRTADGTSTSLTLGNAFSVAGAMIAGNLLVMIAFGLAVIAAALWRPLRLGAALLAGATIPMVAQAISALVLVSEPTSPATFKITQQQASALGLTITNGLTPAFWIYALLLVVLVVSCAWMFVTPGAAMAATAPATGMATGPATGPAEAGAEASAGAPASSVWNDENRDDEDDDDIDWGTPDAEPDVVDSHQPSGPEQAGRSQPPADA